MSDSPVSPTMPDEYDRMLGVLDGLPGLAKTKPTMIRVVPPLGIGGSATYAITTVRRAGEVLEEEEGKPVRRTPATFVTFLEVAKGERLIRLVLPDEVTALIVRQRDSLTARAQTQAAKRAAATRKARGYVPTPPRRRK